jgi:hypothetical protein
MYEEVARVEGSDIAYVFEIRRLEAKTTATCREAIVVLRVTRIFRLEEGRWNLVHRQADPLVGARPLERSIQEPS